MSIAPLEWTTVCPVDDILPNTGVSALVSGRHVAVFRVGETQFYAIDNVDPKSGAQRPGGRPRAAPCWPRSHTRVCGD